MSASWALSNKKRKAAGIASAAVAAADAPPTVRVRRDANTIADFVGRFAFLANGFICQFGVRGASAGGLLYPSVEHALQASKTTDDATRRLIRAAPTGVEAKRIGGKLKVDDPKQWKARSRDVVKALLRDKFKRNKALAQELVETRGKALVYDNQWNDTFWGVRTACVRLVGCCAVRRLSIDSPDGFPGFQQTRSTSRWRPCGTIVPLLLPSASVLTYVSVSSCGANEMTG
jgi:ribA/ribD-fused uncharacterized protein